MVLTLFSMFLIIGSGVALEAGGKSFLTSFDLKLVLFARKLNLKNLPTLHILCLVSHLFQYSTHGMKIKSKVNKAEYSTPDATVSGNWIELKGCVSPHSSDHLFPFATFVLVPK